MKVLILAYDFPPLISIGAQRPYSWYKYLPDNGISVTVITRQWTDKISVPIDYVKEMPQKTYEEVDGNGNIIIRAPFYPNLRDRMLLKYGLSKFVALRKLLTYIYAFLEHLFFLFDSKETIYNAAKNAIEQSKPDLIIATAEPFILFKYAHRLSNKYTIPWVADYRDGWTTNQGNYNKGALSRFLNFFYSVKEKEYIQSSSLITTSSPTYAEPLQKLHPNKEIDVIYNGFDDEYLTGINEISAPRDKFKIAYAGTIYPHQNLEMFLDGLWLFVSKENITPAQLEVCFYGSGSQPQVTDRIMNYRKELKDYIFIVDRIPYGELIKKLRASHLLLLLSKKNAQWLNAKIFDYIAVKRKVVLVENDHGILEQLLKESSSGQAANNVAEFVALLKQEYKLFQQGKTEEMPFNAEAGKYTRKNQAAILAKALRKRFASVQGK